MHVVPDDAERAVAGGDEEADPRRRLRQPEGGRRLHPAQPRRAQHARRLRAGESVLAAEGRAAARGPLQVRGRPAAALHPHRLRADASGRPVSRRADEDVPRAAAGPHVVGQDVDDHVPGGADGAQVRAHQQPRVHGPAGLHGHLRVVAERAARLPRGPAGGGAAQGLLGDSGRAEPGALRGAGGAEPPAGRQPRALHPRDQHGGASTPQLHALRYAEPAREVRRSQGALARVPQPLPGDARGGPAGEGAEGDHREALLRVRGLREADDPGDGASAGGAPEQQRVCREGRLHHAARPAALGQPLSEVEGGAGVPRVSAAGGAPAPRRRAREGEGGAGRGVQGEDRPERVLPAGQHRGRDDGPRGRRRAPPDAEGAAVEPGDAAVAAAADPRGVRAERPRDPVRTEDDRHHGHAAEDVQADRAVSALQRAGAAGGRHGLRQDHGGAAGGGGAEAEAGDSELPRAHGDERHSGRAASFPLPRGGCGGVPAELLRVRLADRRVAAACRDDEC